MQTPRENGGEDASGSLPPLTNPVREEVLLMAADKLFGQALDCARRCRTFWPPMKAVCAGGAAGPCAPDWNLPQSGHDDPSKLGREADFGGAGQGWAFFSHTA